MTSMKKVKQANQRYIKDKANGAFNGHCDFEVLLNTNFAEGISSKKPEDVSDSQLKAFIKIICEDDIYFFISKTIENRNNIFNPYEGFIAENRKRIFAFLIEEKGFKNILSYVPDVEVLYFINEAIDIMPEIYEPHKEELISLLVNKKEKIIEVKYKPLRDALIENIIKDKHHIVDRLINEIEEFCYLYGEINHEIVLDVIKKAESCEWPLFKIIKENNEELWIKNLFRIHNIGINNLNIKEYEKQKIYTLTILEKIKEANITLNDIVFGEYVRDFVKQTPASVFEEIVKHSLQNEIDFLYNMHKILEHHTLNSDFSKSAQENYDKLCIIVEKRKLNEDLASSSTPLLSCDAKRI